MVRSNEAGSIKSNLLVNEVQKRPCLYDTNHPHYGDRGVKAHSWEEVCKYIVPGWNLLSLTDRLTTGKDIQKRWRSIRDSYTKAYRQGKCALPENCQPSSKRYLYHKQMSFLLRALQNKKPRRSIDRNDSELSNSPQPSDDSLIHRTSSAKERSQSPQPIGRPRVDPEMDKNASLEIKIDSNSILPSDYFDDDRLFMNSLLPLLKKMDDDTRLMCRIEVLKIIRYALQSQKETKQKEAKPCSKDVISTLSMTTRSADGSRPMRKRIVRSPSPLQALQKKRGPGRPRKIRRPSSDAEEPRRMERSAGRPKRAEAKISEFDEKLNTHSSVTELETPLFMKMYNLSRSTPPKLHVTVKTEPVDDPVDDDVSNSI